MLSCATYWKKTCFSRGLGLDLQSSFSTPMILWFCGLANELIQELLRFSAFYVYVFALITNADNFWIEWVSCTKRTKTQLLLVCWSSESVDCLLRSKPLFLLVLVVGIDLGCHLKTAMSNKLDNCNHKSLEWFVLREHENEPGKSVPHHFQKECLTLQS